MISQLHEHASETSPVDGKVAEICQTLLARLGWPGDRSLGGLQTLGLTSCYSGEGVSTLAAGLAEAAAMLSGRRVLVVDGNLDRPALHRTFSASLGPGLAEVLLRGDQVSQCVQSTATPGLLLLSAGRHQGNLASAYDAPSLFGLIETLRAQFDLVIFDLPPAHESSPAFRLAGLLDGVLLVVEAERVRAEVAGRAKELLTRDGAKLRGVVMNKRPQHVPGWLYRLF